MKPLVQIPLLSATSALMVGLFLVSGCTKKEDTAPTTTTVYTAGYTRNDAYNLVPCYWKNEERVDLPMINPNSSGFAFAIAVERDTVYTAGYTMNTLDDFIPCYWKNQKRVDLPVSNPTEFGIVEDIQIVNGAVFTAGYTYNATTVPCYWINKTRVDLPVLNPTDFGSVHALDVVENTVYTAGYSGSTPCYWVNNTLIVLPTLSGSGEATDIQVVGNNVYIAGYTINDSFDEIPCYWLNGNRIDLPLLDKELMVAFLGQEGLTFLLGEMFGEDEFNISHLPPVSGWGFGLKVVENTVYTAGGNGIGSWDVGIGEKHPCYWIDQIVVDLPAPPPELYSLGGLAMDIDVFENVVYTAGRIVNVSAGDGQSNPCYWINHDTRVDLPVLATSGGEARAIQVVVK